MSDNDLSLPDLQARFRARLKLSSDDQLDVNERIAEALVRNESRVSLLVIVRFDDGETLVVDDMAEFTQSFESTVYGKSRIIDPKELSLALLGKGEQAYQQYARLTKHLKDSFHEWYPVVTQVTAKYKKPRGFFKRLSHAFDNYEKNYREYRIIADDHLTDQALQEPNHAVMRSLIHPPRLLKASTLADSDTMKDLASSVFSSVSETSRTTLPDVQEEANASSSDSEGDIVLDTSAHEMMEEIKALKRTSVSSSSSQHTRIPMKHIRVRSSGSRSVSQGSTKR